MLNPSSPSRGTPVVQQIGVFLRMLNPKAEKEKGKKVEEKGVGMKAHALPRPLHPPYGAAWQLRPERGGPVAHTWSMGAG